MPVDQHIIDDILARVDLVDLVSERVPLKRVGSRFVARCPFHQEKTPSFGVSAERQLFHCFGCGVGGNALHFLMRYEHLEFRDALSMLADRVGISIESHDKKSAPDDALYVVMTQASSYYQSQLKKAMGEKAREYFAMRGLENDTIEVFGLGYAPPKWQNLIGPKTPPDAYQRLQQTGLVLQNSSGGFYDRFRDRLMFPIRDPRGRVIGFGGRAFDDTPPKYLNSPETPIFHKGKSLYGLYESLRKNARPEAFIVVEGYMDVLMMVQHGITNTVATLGTATSEFHLERLFKHTDRVIFCFDGDAAGTVAAWRALQIALPILQDGRAVYFLFLEKGEDPDSFLRRYGKEAFLEKLKKPMDIVDFMVQTLSEKQDLQTALGQAAFAKAMADLITKVPQGFLSDLLWQRVASMVRMPVAQLKKQGKNKENPTQTIVKRFEKPRIHTPLRKAFMFLLQFPLLIEEVHGELELPSRDPPFDELFLELITRLKSFPSLKTASLIEYWRDHPSATTIQWFAMHEHGLELSQAREEFRGALRSLLEEWRQHHMEALLSQANLRTLSEEEKQKLAELLKTTV